MTSGPQFLFYCSQHVGLFLGLCPTRCDPMDCSPPGSSVHGNSPGKNTGMGCHALLQGIFPTQGSNPDILHFRQTLSHLSHQGTVYKLGVLCPFAPMLWRPPDHYPSPPFSLLPQGQRRARLQGQCCEDCVSPAGSCSHRGLVRYQDDMWKASACVFQLPWIPTPVLSFLLVLGTVSNARGMEGSLPKPASGSDGGGGGG